MTECHVKVKLDPNSGDSGDLPLMLNKCLLTVNFTISAIFFNLFMWCI